MKPDLDDARGILEVFQGADMCWINVNTIVAAGIAEDERLAFHLLLLFDHGALTGIDKHGANTGINNHGISIGQGGVATISPLPLRMTARGHDFLAALQENRVAGVVKSAAVGGLGVAMEMGKAAMTGLMMQTLGLGA